MKSIIKRTIPVRWIRGLRRFYGNHFDGYARKSYSQEGEDMILNRIFEGKKEGFYVDVGAHHPMRFSNTYFFYKKGWKGINIDAAPGSMKRFQQMRPRDINVEIPITNTQKVMTYYIFSEPALNGFSKDISEDRARRGSNKIVSSRELQTKTLAEVLDRYLSAGQDIDFLSIDVEGLDYEVLQSNDWEKYKPKVVLVEILNDGFNKGEHLFDDKVYKFMVLKGYRLFAKSVNTSIFMRG